MRLVSILSIAILIVTCIPPRLPSDAAGVVSAAKGTTDVAVDLGSEVEEESAAAGETELALAGRLGDRDRRSVGTVGGADAAVPAADVSTLTCRGPPVSRLWR